MYQIACILDLRVKTNQLKRNYTNAEQIINRIKSFLKKVYLAEETLLTMSQAKAKKRKSSIKYEFLQEYKAAITTNNNIKQFFTTLEVKDILDKKEN